MNNTTTPIHITKSDHKKITELIQERTPDFGRRPDHLQRLGEELERAELKESSEIGSDVVTLHSKVRIRETDSGDTMEFTLVPPDEADVDAGRISILAPLAIGALGHRCGDEFTWVVAGGSCVAKVEDILFQPEQAMRRNGIL